MSSGIECSDCGEERFDIVASGRKSDGSASVHCLLAGFLFHVFCIPILSLDLTLFIQDKSRMREFRSYGSVRGVLGNRHPYRDQILRFRVEDLGLGIMDDLDLFDVQRDLLLRLPGAWMRFGGWRA